MFAQLTTKTLADWPDVDLLLTLTFWCAVAYLAMSLFIYWRRKSTNLTPVDVPSANRDAQPDFLSVDKKKRKSALKRGDEYERKLDRRERRAATTQIARTAGLFQLVFGYVAVALSMISLLVVLAGSIWPESAVGRMLSKYSPDGRISEVFSAHPIALITALVAILFFILRLFFSRRAATA